MSKLPSDQDASGRDLGVEELELLGEAIESGTLTSTKGTMVKQLELEFAQLIGSPHAVACSSGTAAVHIAVAALDLEPGDEVITTPVTDMGALAPHPVPGADSRLRRRRPGHPQRHRRDHRRPAHRSDPGHHRHPFVRMPGRHGTDHGAGRRARSPGHRGFRPGVPGREPGSIGRDHRRHRLLQLPAGQAHDERRGRHRGHRRSRTWPAGCACSSTRPGATAIPTPTTTSWPSTTGSPSCRAPWRWPSSASCRQRSSDRRAMAERLTTIARRTRRPRSADCPRRRRPQLLAVSRVGRSRGHRGAASTIWPGALRELDIPAAPRYIQKPAFETQVFSEQNTFGTSHWPFSLAASDEALDYSAGPLPGHLRRASTGCSSSRSTKDSPKPHRLHRRRVPAGPGGPMSSSPRVALIGAGGIGGTYAEVFDHLPDRRPGAVCDLDPDIGVPVAKAHGAAFTDDYRTRLRGRRGHRGNSTGHPPRDHPPLPAVRDSRAVRKAARHRHPIGADNGG